ncbi:glycosyltransferase [Paracoccus sp. PARArs4]|uniref:glycosyltransferase n=1 Tax=Paracoccus sp. PARArs4 TaxID=2853442 RepID=UPI0024A6E997|nr:glycosyltransferase [Paracoccus sp. PARArs4]
MALRIAVVAHLRHPIATPFMGGMEAHAWHLVRGLRARGHQVTLYAAGDSDPDFRIHPIIARHYDQDYPWHDFHGTDVLNAVLDDAFARCTEALDRGGHDIVHNNSLHRFPPRHAFANRMPMVTSLHVPPFDGLRRAVQDSAAPWSRFTVCSAQQAGLWWPAGAPESAEVVGNGIDLRLWPFAPTGDGSAVWAGRITPTKGTHLAAQAARIAGVPLTIFGTIEHRDYFEDMVRPHLGGDIRYGGHLEGRELAENLGRSSVMLFTPQWQEPFGLVAIEGMACGLPVASTRIGATPEVIGDCGSFAAPDDAAGLARVLTRAMRIPRHAPRRRVERLFSLDRMLDRYEANYRQAIDAARDGIDARAS